MRNYYLIVIAIAFVACSTMKPMASLPEITADSVSACMYKVSNRGTAPFSVVKDIVEALRATPESVFAENNNADVFGAVKAELGPWTSLKQRAASLGAVMVVQSGFESGWNYFEGRDKSASNTSACTAEAGLYQTSGNINNYLGSARPELIALQSQYCKSTTCDEFQRCTKEPVKAFVHGNFIRASRISVSHWGPIINKKINPWLRKACALQIEALL